MNFRKQSRHQYMNRQPRHLRVFVLFGTAVLVAVLGNQVPAETTAENRANESNAFGETVESSAERSPANAPIAGANSVVRKRYPGGADEDDLQVQTTLPSPSRGLESTEVAPVSESPTEENRSND